MEVKNNYFYFAILLILSVTTLPTNGEYFSKTTKAKLPVLKKTSLHFYLHDILSGKNPGAVLAARPNITLGQQSATPFGSVYAIDDLLTAGPESNSTVVGDAQGLYVSSAKDTLSIVMYVDLGFKVGKFNGSSLSVFSRNPISQGDDRELAVVGGRGKFKFAKGFAKVKTYTFRYQEWRCCS